MKNYNSVSYGNLKTILELPSRIQPCNLRWDNSEVWDSIVQFLQILYLYFQRSIGILQTFDSTNNWMCDLFNMLSNLTGYHISIIFLNSSCHRSTYQIYKASGRNVMMQWSNSAACQCLFLPLFEIIISMINGQYLTINTWKCLLHVNTCKLHFWIKWHVCTWEL